MDEQRSASMQHGWIRGMSSFWMNQNSIFLISMKDNIIGGVENVFWTNMYNLLSIFVEESNMIWKWMCWEGDRQHLSHRRDHK